jgi:hypothetical protein
MWVEGSPGGSVGLIAEGGRAGRRGWRAAPRLRDVEGAIFFMADWLMHLDQPRASASSPRETGVAYIA